jgi:hypothetical protein
MLFLSESELKERSKVTRALADGMIGEAEAGELLMKIDPGTAFLALGGAREDAGDLDEAETLFWQGLEVEPCRYVLYMSLCDLRRIRDPDDVLAKRLMMLAIWKLGFSSKIPDVVAESFGGKSKTLNLKDPETYRMLAAAYEEGDKDRIIPAEVQDRLLPYRLLNDLQRQAPEEVDSGWVQEILTHSARCLPLWRAALREWGRSSYAVSTKALALIVAWLGEIGDVDVLDDLFDLMAFPDETIYLHANWAIWRIGQRFPSETLAKLRAATPSGNVTLRCGLAEQLNLLPELEGLAPALLDLLEGFSGFADDMDAPYLLIVVADALSGIGLGEEAERAMSACQRMLPEKGKKALRDLSDGDGEFIPRLVEEEIDERNIEDVCLGRSFMVDEDDEDDEETGGGESSAPRAPLVRPDRNDPCWCGSGKKYKKCHLAADEEAERGNRKSEAKVKKPQLAAGISFYGALVRKVLDSGEQIRSRAELFEAHQRYFERKAGDVESEIVNESGFFEWYMQDFRPGGKGRTLVEEYLRRNSARLGARERALLNSWRAARFGLYEVQDVKKGIGVEMKDLFAGSQFFVHDVSASKSAVRWDCIFARFQQFEGRWIFTGNGITVVRTLLPPLVAIVEEESRAAGQTAAAYVRANSHRWYQVLTKLHQGQLAGRRMVNPEEDEIEFSSATYLVRDEEGLVAALAAAEVFVETTEKDETPGIHTFGWLETGTDGPRRAYGHIGIRDGRLRFECNSRRRLATGRQLIEKNAGAFLMHEGDTFESLAEAKERMEREGPPKEAAETKGVPPEIEREVLLQLKTEHYANWPDESLPALGGRTPREAVKSEVGRRAVEDLIRMMENGEERQRQEGGAAFDFAPIRKTLGLDG